MFDTNKGKIVGYTVLRKTSQQTAWSGVIFENGKYLFSSEKQARSAMKDLQLSETKKTYSGHKDLDKLKKVCKLHSWHIFTKSYDEGSDYIEIRWIIGLRSGFAFINMVNGRYFGDYCKLEEVNFKTYPYSSDDSDNDHECWFVALMDALYISSQIKKGGE